MKQADPVGDYARQGRAHKAARKRARYIKARLRVLAGGLY